MCSAGRFFRAVIIDDEPDAVAVLQLQLQSHCPQVQVVASTTYSEQGEALLRLHQPDLLFLDVEMPRLNGFQLLERVEDLDFQVIFTTAYDQYALRAFRFSALDYLLKPIDIVGLTSAVARLERRKHASPQQLDILREQLEQAPKLPERIALPHLKGYLFQEVAEIIYCEASNTYTRFFMEGKREPMLVSWPLGELESLLSGPFFRIHRQYLVQLKKINELLRTDGGSVIMSNGDQLPIARNRRQELIELLVK
jgi:two-component system LytT family response regulator